MFQTSQDADGALGEALTLLSTAEGNLRVFTHDVLYPHHDKDVRSLSPFPISLLQDVELVVWLLDYWGQMRSIVISPASGLVKTRAYVLVHRMHARALAPIDQSGGSHDLTKRVTALTANGWEQWMDGDCEEGLIPSQALLKCKVCIKQAEARLTEDRAGFQEERIHEPKPLPEPDWQSIEDQPSIAGLKHRPPFAWGVLVREIFSGWHGISDEADSKRIPCIRAAPPVDKWQNPDKKTGYQAHFDCSLPAVRKELEEEMASLPGPDVPNVYFFQNPCVTFSSWQLLNQGTRTFTNPQGDGSSAAEEAANNLTAWLAKCLLIIHDAGKMAVFENQEPDGRYPKVWNLGPLQKAMKRIGAVVIPSTMCAFGLSPPDQPGLRHRKRLWLMISPDLMPFMAFMWRRCGSRDHVPLAGNVPGSSMNRTQSAARYPAGFCRAFLACLHQAYEGGRPRRPLSSSGVGFVLHWGIARRGMAAKAARLEVTATHHLQKTARKAPEMMPKNP
jgi:hypothetical protein